MSLKKSSSFRTTAYGKYFLLDRIAVGGMAEVFKAKTFGVRGFERLLVIKRILPHLSKDEDFVEMFIDEAKISVELSHSNIVQVTDLGKIADNYFIAMEYIDGKDLRAILKKLQTTNKELSIPQVTFIAIEICKGLDYAHRKKSSATNKPLDIIHRDISPQNIMVSFEGEAKVVDFGIAKTASKLNQTQAGVLKGKFGYMSPEQAMGLDVDQRTDIFSTGILLFEMLTGRRLFLGETDFETLEKIKEAKTPPPSMFNKKVPKELDRITQKALAKDLSKRYQNIKEMQVDLTKFFYSEFPDFTASNLSSFLKKLFHDEIKEDRQKLKKSLSALPIEDLIDSELASHSDEQLIDSQNGAETVSSKSHSVVLSQNEGITSLEKISVERTSPSLSKSLYEKTVGQIFKSSDSASGGPMGWLKSNKYLAIGVLFLVLFAGVFIAMYEPGEKIDTKPIETPIATPKIPVPKFKIDSYPPNAKVYLNGEYLGKTPLSAELALEEFLNIDLKLSGYEDVTKRFFLKKDDDKELTFTLSKVIKADATIEVESTPSNASIVLNGENTGLKTPATLQNLSWDKKYTVEVSLSGYNRMDKAFTPTKDQNNKLNFTLTKITPALKISSSPQGAKVSISGFKERKTPAIFKGVRQGKSYKITVYKNGYDPLTETVKVDKIFTSKYFTLKKASIEYGYLSINAVPYAEIYIDGKLIGYTPKPNHKVKVGKHTLLFKHPSAPDITKQITVSKEKEERVIVKMDVRD